MLYKQVNRFICKAELKCRSFYNFYGKAAFTMSKDEISFKNRDRFIQMGIAISSLRKMRGMTQEQLAEKASISRSHLSAIEAPNMVRAFSMEAFFNIADALDVTPEELIQIAFLQDKILKRKS